jgi:hypothetical protein
MVRKFLYIYLDIYYSNKKEEKTKNFIKEKEKSITDKKINDVNKFLIIF